MPPTSRDYVKESMKSSLRVSRHHEVPSSSWMLTSLSGSTELGEWVTIPTTYAGGARSENVFVSEACEQQLLTFSPFPSRYRGSRTGQSPLKGQG